MDKLLLCINAAIVAGKEILKIYKKDFTVEQKANNTPLTEADQKSHDIIFKLLQATKLPILSEEGREIPYEERKSWDEFWLVDPLDGTKEFIKKNDEFTVNIALIKNGKPTLGVIYVPVQDNLYFANEELGAKLLKKATLHQKDFLLKSQALNIKDKKMDSNIVQLVCSRSHLSKETKDFVNQLETKYKKVSAVSAGSSLKLCLIAENKADIYPRFGPTMEWDTAAGQAIVEFAGGEVLKYPELTPMLYNKENLLNSWFFVKSKNLKMSLFINE